MPKSGGQYVFQKLGNTTDGNGADWSAQASRNAGIKLNFHPQP
jgi:hypothetical protein